MSRFIFGRGPGSGLEKKAQKLRYHVVKAGVVLAVASTRLEAEKTARAMGAEVVEK